MQSRYYDPVMRRFINADDIRVMGISGTFLSANLYSYCENKPTMFEDTQGQFIGAITGAIVGGIIGGITAASKGDNIWAGIGVGAATGALAGITTDIAIATGGVGAVAIAAVGGAISSGINYSATEIINGREIDPATLIVESSVGAITNLLAFGIGGGSLDKVSGQLINNMKDNLVKSVMANTTRKVAGKVVYKSVEGVAKNIAKNLTGEFLMTATVSGGAFLLAQMIGGKING